MAITPATNNAPATQGKPATLVAFLSSKLPVIKQAAASHLKPERLLRIVVSNVQKTPALKKCSFDSILRCTVQAAELGLEPGSAIGDAYLVPYKEECQLIPGYRGLIKLAYRSGHVSSVMASPVYQGDTFEFEMGLNPKLRHVPNLEGERDPKMITYFYCVVHLTDGGYLYDVMTKGDVDRIRAKSKAGNSGPWVEHYAEMGRKTVVRRCLKYAPMSVEIQKAIALDHAADTGETVDAEFDLIEVSDEEMAEALPSKSERIAEKIGATDAQKPEESDAWTVFGDPVDTQLRTMGMPHQEASDWESAGWTAQRMKLALGGAKGDLAKLRETLQGDK